MHLILRTGDDCKIELYDLRTNTQVRAYYKALYGPVSALCWAMPSVFFVGCADASIHMFKQNVENVSNIYTVKTCKAYENTLQDEFHSVMCLMGPHQGAIEALDCKKSRDGCSFLVSCGMNGSIGLWHIDNDCTSLLKLK